MTSRADRIAAALWHGIMHLFGWNCGRVETWWEGQKLMVGFRCSCGELMDKHESRVTR